MQNKILSETVTVPSDGTQGNDQNSAQKWLQMCRLHTALKQAQRFSSTGGFLVRKTSLCMRSKHGFGREMISQVQGDVVTEKLSPVPWKDSWVSGGRTAQPGARDRKLETVVIWVDRQPQTKCEPWRVSIGTWWTMTYTSCFPHHPKILTCTKFWKPRQSSKKCWWVALSGLFCFPLLPTNGSCLIKVKK